MQKITLTLAALLALTVASFAQNAKTNQVEINKASQPCVVAEYSLPAEMVEGALKKKFSDAKLGSGSKATDNFRVYKGVVIPEISQDKMDVYYKIEDKKPTTLLYMLTSKGYDNFMKMETDSLAVSNTITYLDKFVRDATAFDLGNQIKRNNEAIEEIEKKSKKAAKESESLAKDKAKVESKISKNTIELGALKTEMEAQQSAYELVKTKTATIDEMKSLKKEVDKQESAMKKATKNYESAVKEGANNREDLAKKEKEIADKITEQNTLRAELETQRVKLEELKTQLNNLK
jgi:hypothetical protein